MIKHVVKNVVSIKNRVYFFLDRFSFSMLFCGHRGFLSFFVINIIISIKIGKLVALSLALSLFKYMYHFWVSHSYHITPPPTAHGEAVVMAVSFTGRAGVLGECGSGGMRGSGTYTTPDLHFIHRRHPPNFVCIR